MMRDQDRHRHLEAEEERWMRGSKKAKIRTVQMTIMSPDVHGAE